MNPEYRIRRCAQESDAEAIHALVTELAAFERQPHAVTQTVDDYKKNAFQTNPPLFLASLAELKSENEWLPVGLAVWYFTYSTWTGKSFYLEDLYVRPQHRRQGLGRRLLTHCIKEAHTSGCARIDWVVLNWNSRAIQIYQSIGAVSPDDGVWNLMRMDQQAIQKYIATSSDST